MDDSREAVHRRERRLISDLFLELGPDAPTLCEGWTTFDLAAHLAVRERRPTAGPGIVAGDRIAALGRHTEKLMEREKQRGYEAVVERVRTGPPVGLFRVLDAAVNTGEYAIHHEDVRRANGRGPRDDTAELQDALWARLPRGARLFLRRLPKGIGVRLAPPGREPAVARKGDRVVQMAGDPLELQLWLFGRKADAEVELSGDPEAVTALEATNLGL